ncbi:MAG: alpha/beta hydrolase [Chloroflexota bacterium]
MKQHSKNSITKYLLWGMVVSIIGLLIWGVQWATYARPPLPEAIQALESDGIVSVTTEPWLTFMPTEESPKTGLIFYPGGRVDPRGYAVLARTIAAEGYVVVIPSMLINMAFFNPNAADDIIAQFTNIEDWAIAGHSLGGTMAIQYTKEHAGNIEGLVIWSSYPANSSDISAFDIPVVSIYGSRELKVTDDSVGERAHLLPADTLYISIKGGDHHQFGSYEINPKNHLATTSRASQQKQIVEATLAVMLEVEQ